MATPFYMWLYERLIAEEILDPADYSDPDDISTMEDITSDADINIDADELETYAHSYRVECSDNLQTPDFTGYEDLA